MAGSRIDERLKFAFPWGRYVGFLTTLSVMLVGIIQGNQPTTIITRSILSGIVLGCLVGFGMGLVHLVNADRRRSRRQPDGH